MSDTTVQLEDGKLNAFGIDISIADVLGSKLVDQWMARLTPEDLQLIYDAIEAEIFSHNYKDEKYFVKQVEKPQSWGRSELCDTPIWRATQDAFNAKYKKTVIAKVDEIIASEKYQQKAQQIAEEIVEYATEGYKQDMLKRVKERLVNNVIDTQPSYNNVNLSCIINECIDERLRNTRYN